MEENAVSRRSFLTSTAAGATAFQIVKPELVRGAGNEKLRAGLVGCGSRGTEAIQNVLNGTDNVEIVALADVFEDRLEDCLRKSKALKPELADRVKVDAEHHFVGFDAYKKVIASVDIVMLATYPAYRPMHFEAAVEAKKHIFCEKPFATDPVNVRKFMAAAKKSEELKLTVKSGAQRRSQAWYLDQYKRMKNGDIGDIVALNANWVGSPVLKFNNDECSPTTSATPAGATWSSSTATGTRSCGSAATRSWSSICTTSTSATGSWARIRWKRSLRAARRGVRGKKSTATSTITCMPTSFMPTAYTWRATAGSTTTLQERQRADCRDQGPDRQRSQRGGKPAVDPYVQEHIDMVNSILGKGPYINEAMAVAESTMTCLMGREAAYSGQKVTWDMMMNSQLDLLPKSFDYKAAVPVPPLPVPGVYKFV